MDEVVTMKYSKVKVACSVTACAIRLICWFTWNHFLAIRTGEIMLVKPQENSQLISVS